jgi:ubiquinone/menaquinone biosynthesis C-methylase UbiE
MHQADWAVVWERQAGRAALWPTWLDRAGVQPGEKVLDIGCGPGFTSLLISERVGPTGHVWALDRAPAALDYLRARQVERGVAAVEPLLGSATAIPLPDSSVDCVVVAHTLHHSDDPAGVLREVGRVLAPAGRALIIEYDPAGRDDIGPPRSARLPATTVRVWLPAAGLADTAPEPAEEGRYLFVARKAA